MNILVVTHHLVDFAGSETFTFTLVKELKNLGHKVSVCSPALGRAAEKISDLGVQVSAEIDKLGDQSFDVIHAQHNVTTIQARAVFPKTPIVFVSHGVLPPLEQPPTVPLGISRFVAVSEEVLKYDAIKYQVPVSKIALIRNGVDIQRFWPMNLPNERLQRVLILSNRIDPETGETIRAACRNLGLELDVVGAASQSVWNIEDYINKADLVFSLGRGALEAMSCGRAVLVYDYLGGDGMVTGDNIDEIKKCNFSGRRFNRKFSSASLENEMRLYTQGMGQINRDLVQREFGSHDMAEKFLAVYQDAIAEFSQRRPEQYLLPMFEITFYQREYLRERETTARLIQDVQELQKKTNARIQTLQSQTEKVTWDRDYWLKLYREMEADRDRWLKLYKEMEADRDRWLKLHNELVPDRDRWRADYKVLEADRDHWLALHNDMVADRDRWQATTETVVAESQKISALLDAARAELENSRRMYAELKAEWDRWKALADAEEERRRKKWWRR